jgi:hypothetical protein
MTIKLFAGKLGSDISCIQQVKTSVFTDPISNPTAIDVEPIKASIALVQLCLP